eukprot:9481974-Pyramimonas_sp.AAC.1
MVLSLSFHRPHFLPLLPRAADLAPSPMPPAQPIRAKKKSGKHKPAAERPIGSRGGWQSRQEKYEKKIADLEKQLAEQTQRAEELEQSNKSLASENTQLHDELTAIKEANARRDYQEARRRILDSKSPASRQKK